MTRQEQQFVLKGNRDYVHGTSIFNAVIAAARKKGHIEGKINLSFKRMIRNPVCIIEYRPGQAEDAVIAGISTADADTLNIVINEAQKTAEAQRQPFDEAAVCKGAVIGSKHISQDEPHHKDLIELLVSLCKKMHQECLDADKKWVFSRYEGEFPIPEPKKVELFITRQVGTRLTCSDVVINGKKIANLYFS